MTQVITASKEMERQARDKATEKLHNMAPLGPSITGAAAMVEQENEFNEDEEHLEEEGEIVDFTKCKIREIQALTPVPEQLDPFTEALLAGVDPMAAHQALTLVYPMLGFLGNNMRVLYADGKLRYVNGQGWQMGGSRRGKSIVLRSLEELFLSKDIAEKNAAVKRAADYSLLSEKEQKEVAPPRVVIRIFDSIPTAIALLKQMQINGGGAVYLSCSECGELGKKIGTVYYSVLLDMLKKGYDGVGEPFLHETSSKIYFVESMKIFSNIGGTEDPMYKVFSHCDSDGTLSRGVVTILGEPKDEVKEGPYKSPSWTEEQVKILLRGANRLRNFDNRFNENQNENQNNDKESDERVYESAKDSDGSAPTVEEYNISLQRERERHALCIPAIVSFGKEIKSDLSRIGEIADDCCSRAFEVAQGMCYLLYVANGLAEIPEGERDAKYHETMHRIFDVVRWWINRSMECAIAIQTRLNANSKSHREEIRLAYKQTIGASSALGVFNEREMAFVEYEKSHAGEIVNVRAVINSIELLKKLNPKTVSRDIKARGWEEFSHGKYRVPKKED